VQRFIGFGRIKIAGGYVGAAYLNVADVLIGQRLIIVRSNAQLAQWNRLAHGDQGQCARVTRRQQLYVLTWVQVLPVEMRRMVGRAHARKTHGNAGFGQPIYREHAIAPEAGVREARHEFIAQRQIYRFGAVEDQSY